MTKLGAVSVDLRSDANDPIDVELLVSSFELPDVLRQFRRVLAVLVPERRMFKSGCTPIFLYIYIYIYINKS